MKKILGATIFMFFSFATSAGIVNGDHAIEMYTALGGDEFAQSGVIIAINFVCGMQTHGDEQLPTSQYAPVHSMCEWKWGKEDTRNPGQFVERRGTVLKYREDALGVLNAFRDPAITKLGSIMNQVIYAKSIVCVKETKTCILDQSITQAQ